MSLNLTSHTTPTLLVIRRIVVICCMAGLTVSCSSDSDIFVNRDVPFDDTHYISIETDVGTAYLQANRFDEPPAVQAVVNFDLESRYNHSFSWFLGGENAVTIHSRYRRTTPNQNLVILADDGLMQIHMVDDAAAGVAFANWTLTPLGNGRCHISNAGLGAELVLSVTSSLERPSGMEWHIVEMASIDDALPQEWTVTRIGDPPGDYEQMCSGSP